MMSQEEPDAAHTLLHHLSMKSPQVHHSLGRRGKTNTRNQHYSVPTSIARWEDFNRDSLERCCGGIFAAMLTDNMKRMEFPHLERDVIRFSDEASLEKQWVSQWMHPILQTALRHAQEMSSDRGIQFPFVEMVPGGNAGKHGGGWKPDWAGIRTDQQDDPEQVLNILPGDTKINFKWKSANIIDKDVEGSDLTANWIWPLRQILTYCLSVNTRYGYIVTEDEIVAFRVKALSEQLDKDSPRKTMTASWKTGVLEYVSVRDPAQNPSADELTRNLALWWLHLLAANKKTIETTYEPLDKEALDGLGRAPSPVQNEISSARATAVADRGSPASTVRTETSLAATDVTNDDVPIFSFQSGPGHSFTSGVSASSVRSKRKRDWEQTEDLKRPMRPNRRTRRSANKA